MRPKKRVNGTPTTDDADIVIYRDANGGLRIWPGVYVAHVRSRSDIVIANFADKQADLEWDSVKGSLDAPGARSDHKKSFLSADLKLKKGRNAYSVKVGNDYGVGNSSPTIIIDD